MTWSRDLIIIKDNFFEETLFKKIQADLDTVKFENRYGRDLASYVENDEIAVKGGDSHKLYFDVILSTDHPAATALRAFFKSELGIIVKKMESLYLLSTKHEEASPHTDRPRAKINCLIYLKGGSLVHNGTALYEDDGKNWNINSHIGFKENRMVMFASDITHSSLQFAEGATARFIMGNWINEYELE